MFEEKKVIALFPSLVWTHDLRREEREPLNAQLAREIDSLISPRPQLTPGQTWQTEQDLHRREAFAELMPYIREAASSTLDFLEIEYDAFEITGCWANANPHGAPHVPHTHPNNYLSGVYYVRVPPGGDTVSFHDPRGQLNVIAPRVRRPNNHNSSQINIPVKEGRLIVFPSWFKHSVLPNMGDGERISISFNIMFSSFTETMSPPKWRGISDQGTR